MRDLLPAEAELQQKLASGVLEVFELYGYQRVVVPAVEYADVLSKGLGVIEAHSMLRFIESETGEVVALRPDMTPQIARLVATRLKDRASPARICYQGSVLRRQHERARHDQQSLQAGIELIGAAGTDSDLEVLTVCVQAVRKSGLKDFVLDLGHGGIATSLLKALEETARWEILEALSLKDGLELSRRARLFGLDLRAEAALVGLLSLQGGALVFAEAEGILGKTSAWPLVQQLEKLYRRIECLDIVPKIVIDLGETSAVPYYTGPTFQILAEGPGRPVASGGRYDALYEQFGAGRPAAGGAIHLDHLRWALGENSSSDSPRVLVVSSDGACWLSPEVETVLSLLREAGIPSVCTAPESAIDYAQAWRYSHIVRVQADSAKVSLLALRGETEEDLGVHSIEEICSIIRL